MHRSFGFGDLIEGVALLDFAIAFELVVANSSFPKENHLVTFRSIVAKTQIDYLFIRKDDGGLCKGYNVISGKYLITQHKLLTMDLEINLKVVREKLVSLGARTSSGMQPVCGI